jgi:hypothetical protein
MMPAANPSLSAVPKFMALLSRATSKAALLLAILLGCAPLEPDVAAQPVTHTNVTILLVRGADGEPDYAPRFDQQLDHWRAVAERAGAECRAIGIGQPDDETPATDESAASPSDRDRLRTALLNEGKAPMQPLWLVLIGHGTFDGKQARFNLQGPDVSASELATWLQPLKRPLVIINTSAASAPFMAALSGPDRVVITATRSGNEQSYARFGEFLAQTMAAPAADLDQDGQTSLLEAFLSAASKVAEFYETEGRLATEHALIEDNADGLGTPADWFRGTRAVRKADDNRPLDGMRAHQIHLVLSAAELALSPEIRAARNDLERQLFTLREQKEALPAADYYPRLEELLLKIARLYDDPDPEG